MCEQYVTNTTSSECLGYDVICTNSTSCKTEQCEFIFNISLNQILLPAIHGAYYAGVARCRHRKKATEEGNTSAAYSRF